MVRATCRPIWIAAGATPGTGLPSCSTAARSPTTNTSSWPGSVRSGRTRTRPARSSGTPSAFGSGDAVTPAAHTTVRATIRSRTEADPRGVDTGDARARPDVHAQPLELSPGLDGEVLGIGWEHARRPLDQDDAGVSGVDLVELP